MDPTQPFVLLDDASRAGAMRLFEAPVEIVTAPTLGDVRPALARLRQARRDGLWSAGFIGFEAGHALEPRLAPLARTARDGLPLLWFGLFDRVRRIDPGELPDGRAAVEGVNPQVTRAAHGAAVARAQALIGAGDIYQVNLTFPCDVAASGHPLALYRRLRGAAAAPWSAAVHTGGSWALSFSPELFFTLRGGTLTARPMKGTARRAPTPEADRAVADGLAADPKNRAENLMIVDLLRNDLSRVAAGVSVEALFAIESYPTVHQMTSTVTGTLHAGRDAIDVIEALFPCGSVTGTPKIRAMEIIHGLEPQPRGLYTGSIGVIEPDGDAAFNVAIRTLTMAGGAASIGLGSAIVADSDAPSEWDECLAKGAFLTARPRRFDLIETMRFEPGGILRLDRHLARLARSAAHWGFRFDGGALRAILADALSGRAAPARVRLVLARSGAAAVQVAEPPAQPAGPVSVTLRTEAPTDLALLAHKISDRSLYRVDPGAFETLRLTPEGFLTEGAYTNLFVERGGKLLTPPLSRGLLPGILREALLESGRAVEQDLTPADLTGGFLIGNALRGLLPARLSEHRHHGRLLEGTKGKET